MIAQIFHNITRMQNPRLILLGIAVILVAVTSTEVHAYSRGALQDWEPQPTISTMRRLIGKGIPIIPKGGISEVTKAMAKLDPPTRGRSVSEPTKQPTLRPSQHWQPPSAQPTDYTRRTSSASPTSTPHKRVTYTVPLRPEALTSTFTLGTMAKAQGRSKYDSIAAG